MDHQVLQGLLGSLDLLDRKALADHQDHQDLVASLDQVDSLVHLVH